MDTKHTLESWMIKVVLVNPRTLDTRGPHRPTLYTQGDVDDLVRSLRDDLPPAERRLLSAELNQNGQIEAWLTASADKPVKCVELADLCARALALRPPTTAHCTESQKFVTEVDWSA